MKPKISVIIPAYNEEKNIASVLKTLKQVREIDEIVVINDGSNDNTGRIVSKINGVRLISLEKNQGKTKAVLTGIDSASYENILLFDADLVGMKKKYVQDLIKKYLSGYDMVIMDKDGAPWIFGKLLKSVPAESGVRILRKKYFDKIPILHNDRFQLEVRINDYFLDNNLKIGIVSAPGVHDPRKFIKYSFLQGLYLDIKGGLEILLSNGVLNIPKTISTWRRIHDLKGRCLPRFSSK